MLFDSEVPVTREHLVARFPHLQYARAAQAVTHYRPSSAQKSSYTYALALSNISTCLAECNSAQHEHGRAPPDCAIRTKLCR